MRVTSHISAFGMKLLIEWVCIGLLVLEPVLSHSYNHPTSVYHRRRLSFYENEKKAMEKQTVQSLSYNVAEHLRIAYFDAHWHGLSIEEYFRVAGELQGDVLIARGVPVKGPYRHTVNSRLVQAGFDKSSFVAMPLSVLSSGIIIGVRNDVKLLKSSTIMLHNSTVGYLIHVKVPLYPGQGGKASRLRLVILNVDPYDSRQRQVQMDYIKTVVDKLNFDRPAIVMGGFYSTQTFWGGQVLGLDEFSGPFLNVYSALGRDPPQYTSWHGGVTDTFLVSSLICDDIVQTGMWHIDTADSLPIFLDVSRMQLATKAPFSLLQRFEVLFNYNLVAALLALLLLVMASLVVVIRAKSSECLVSGAGLADADSEERGCNRLRRPSVCSHEHHCVTLHDPVDAYPGQDRSDGHIVGLDD